MIKMAAKEGIVLFALPPHTTHLCQPLDKGPFAPLKIEWRKVVHKFVSANKGREVTVYDFNTVFSEAWYNAMTASNVISGFRCTGIYPFNRNAVKARSEKFRRFDQDALSKGIKINYVPLFSPDRARHTDSNLDTEDENDSSSSASSPPLGNSRCNTLPPIQHKTLKDFLVTPKAPNRGKGPVPKGRVLTSRQNLLLLEEQKKKKQEEAQLKEDRKNLREEKLRLKKLKVSGKLVCNNYAMFHILLSLSAATRKASKSARSRIATKTSVTTVDGTFYFHACMHACFKFQCLLRICILNFLQIFLLKKKPGMRGDVRRDMTFQTHATNAGSVRNANLEYLYVRRCV